MTTSNKSMFEEKNLSFKSNKLLFVYHKWWGYPIFIIVVRSRQKFNKPTSELLCGDHRQNKNVFIFNLC